MLVWFGFGIYQQNRDEFETRCPLCKVCVCVRSKVFRKLKQLNGVGDGMILEVQGES